MESPEARLDELGLELPPLRPAAGNYVGWVAVGDLLFLAGQGADGYVGRVGDDYDIPMGQEAAQACMLNLLAQTKQALGSLDRVKQVVKVLGLVQCTEDFTQVPTVMNGASDLLVEVFGSRGRHGRSAVGVQSLPLGLAVEIEMVVQADGVIEPTLPS